MSIAPLPGQDLTTPAPKMAGYEFRLATVKEARNELLLYLKKKPLPDARIQSDQVKPPFSLNDRPILILRLGELLSR